MSMWFSFGTIVGYGVDYNVTTAAGRLLTLGLYIFKFSFSSSIYCKLSI